MTGVAARTTPKLDEAGVEFSGQNAKQVGLSTLQSKEKAIKAH